ncbi:MAG TPA: ectonucleotide pyrophosphatase/phosphodiesterase [Bryobacteraceae bacterium]|nr:ectonucleotide pyrophosphatase/phosphodiesterase [Bryobacteraceae bacterium]
MEIQQELLDLPYSGDYRHARNTLGRYANCAMQVFVAVAFALFLAAAAPFVGQPAGGANQPALLLVSVDGMRPDYVLKADQYNLKIPRLRRLFREGTHATGVRGVLPTVTFPSHTTILTGVWPVKHGIYSNGVFDPLGTNAAGWQWYSEDIHSPTLWELAAKAGVVVGSVAWPVSVGAPGVSYLIPEYWRAPKSEEDIKLLRSLSTRGLIAEIEKTCGSYITDMDQAALLDRQRTCYAVAILRNKRTRFTTVHFAALDHVQHQTGPFSVESLKTLEQLDQELGDLEDAARATYPQTVVCVVSDHGFTRTDHSLNLLSAFVSEGLVTMTNGHVSEWKAYPQGDGGSAAVVLKEPHDEVTRMRVAQLLDRLANNADNGIARVLGPKEIESFGGWARAAFWVDMQPNFSIVAAGPLTQARKVGGTHGYLPSHPELLASFFIAGPDIRPGVDLGEVDMRAVAPTLARVLSMNMPSADLEALPIFEASKK